MCIENGLNQRPATDGALTMKIFPRFKKQLFSAFMSSYTLAAFCSNFFLPACALTVIDAPQTVGQNDTVSIENSVYQNLVSGFDTRYALVNNGTITSILNSSFLDNGIFSLGNTYGTGIYNTNHIGLIDESTFSNNKVAGIDNYASTIDTIQNSFFESNNTAISNTTDENNGILTEAHINLIDNSQFNKNLTGISNQGSITDIKGSFFNENSVGIYNNAYTVPAEIQTISDSKFTNNAMGISNADGAYIGTIENSVFENNQNAIRNSGRGTDEYTSEIVLIENALFLNNQNTTGDYYNEPMASAIYNAGGKIESILTTEFQGNSVTSVAPNRYVRGGAVYNGGEIKTMKNVVFNNNGIAVDTNLSEYTPNYETSAGALGGAVYNEGKIGYIDEDGNYAGGFINTSFTDNYAIANGENVSAKGGAVYSDENIRIEANNGYHSLISGNYTEVNGIKDDNAIYMGINEKETSYSSTKEGNVQTSVQILSKRAPSLVLDANTNGIIQIDDKISGDKGEKETQIVTVFDADTSESSSEETVLSENKDQSYKIYITGDNTGTVILNNDVEGEADMYLYQTTLKLGKRDDVLKNNNMTFNSGTFDMVNNNIGSTNFNTLTLNNNIKTKADVDLINETMDRITSDNYIINENKLNDKLISVDYLNLLNDSTKDSVKILYADEEISSNVEYIGSNPIQVSKDKIAYSPIYKYTVSYDIDENDNMGYFTFNRGNINDSNSYNPSVLAPSVSSQAGAYTTQLQTLEYAFKHSDAFMALPSFERMAIINADRYALTPTSDATDIGTFSPLMTKLDVSGFWVKPYTSFESIPLDNGPKVSNISYGTLVGYDSNLKHLKNGWERVLTGYIGYNGASQRYSGIDTYQNGGILGLTTTFYKNNFFNATTISTGATVGNSSTYYGDEDYTMLTAGIGNKFGYNFEFKDGKFILQPNLLLSYTFINTFDYTNAAGLKIKSDPLHALQIAPGIKFIMNTESGWQPYLRADMIWNILDKTKVTANDVRLPEMSIDPYVQYGIGVQKLFKNERLTFFGQALVQNGGRNGVSLNAGLRWAVGKGE